MRLRHCARRDPEPFDWFQRYSGIKELVGQYLKKSDKILNVGAGNSRLTEEMFEDGESLRFGGACPTGALQRTASPAQATHEPPSRERTFCHAGYHTIDNVDVSETCVRAMEEAHKDLRGVNWRVMDVLDMKDIPDGTYDAVIDKAMLDSVLCGEGSSANAAKFLAGVSRTLKSVGVYFCVSYGIPDNRMTYLDNEAYGWTVKVHTVAKPTVSAAASAGAGKSGDPSSVHYIYVCQKTS